MATNHSDMSSVIHMPKQNIREFVRVRQEGKSSVINNAVFQGLRYEHGGGGHEAEVAINVSV
jgi:hypothetical protein